MQLFSERLVAHYTGGVGVAGSNPAVPTILRHCKLLFFRALNESDVVPELHLWRNYEVNEDINMSSI